MAIREITVGGEKFPVEADVLNWEDSEGLNGYDTRREEFSEENRKTGRVKRKVVKGRRYTRTLLSIGGRINKVRGFVVHHSGGFTAKQCFETLHNRRKLSAQFIIDDHGVVYQTLDALEIAWHAGKANKFTTGVECVLYPDAERNIDAYRPNRQMRLGVAPHEIMKQYIQGKKRTVFKMPHMQLNALAEVIAAFWVARYKHPKSKLLNSSYMDISQPYFITNITGSERIICADYIKKSLTHTGLLMHANLSPRKWDAAGIDYKQLEQNAGKRFYEMIKARK